MLDFAIEGLGIQEKYLGTWHAILVAHWSILNIQKLILKINMYYTFSLITKN